MRASIAGRALAGAWCVAALTYAQTTGANPTIAAVVEGVSVDRIAAHMRKLASFGTRDSHSAGNVAARQWIAEEFRSYSPRLQVRMDVHRLRKKGRIVRDLEIANVIAVLPGTVDPTREVVISAHYDSLSLVPKKDAAPGEPDSMDNEASAAEPLAPGVSDDASGVSAVLELARVMSRQQFGKTIVFAAFAAEEQGLIGSTLYATRAQESGERIEAVLNNDVIGNDRAGNGVAAPRVLHVFSGGPEDSASRALARYVREAAGRFVPGMQVELVFRADRFARGGDHTPFHERGFGAVRLTTAAEALERQHTAKDDLDSASPAYTARVAQVNGAALASLALAPAPPVVERRLPATESRPERIIPNLTRGKGRYDAVLRWTDPNPEGMVAGFAVLIRSTLAPFWEREIPVGKTLEYTIQDFAIDAVVLGVKAVGRNGVDSLVSAYVTARYRGQPFEVMGAGTH